MLRKPVPPWQQPDAWRSERLVLPSHQLEGGPGPLPNLPRNVHARRGSHCCAKPLEFWVMHGPAHPGSLSLVGV